MIHSASGLPTHVDEQLFQRYLLGDTVDDVLTSRQQQRMISSNGTANSLALLSSSFQSADGILPNTASAATSAAVSSRVMQRYLDWFVEFEPSVVREGIEEQFTLFALLEEQHLQLPYVFLSATGVPISLAQRRKLVNMYYALDARLAGHWFGDRSTRLDDLEDGELQEEGLDTIKEVCMRRQLANLKRVSKFVTSGYRCRDNMCIPHDLPLQDAIERIFCLTPWLASQYATFVFGFEHRLDSKSVERLEYDELSNLCHVAGALWCDASKLLLRDDFCDDCYGISMAIGDTKVGHDLYVQVFGELPRMRWHVLDDVHKAITTSATSGQQGSNTATTFNQVIPTGPVSSAVSGEQALHSPVGGRLPSVPSNPSLLSAAMISGPTTSACNGFSRRFMAEHFSLLKQFGRIARDLHNNRSLRDALDSFFYKLLFRLEREDASASPQQSGGSSNSTQQQQQTGSVVVGGGGLSNSSSSSQLAAGGAPPSSGEMLNTSLVGVVGVAQRKQLLRELSVWMGLIAPAFAGVGCISAADHRDLDEPLRDLFAVLRVFLQITLAHEEE